MKDNSYSSEKNSARRFRSFISLAISITLMSLLPVKGHPVLQNKNTSAQKPDKARQKIEHIPPPFTIEDGSLELKSSHDLQYDQQSGSRPHKYRPLNGPRFIEAVKVQTQAGETLFPNTLSPCDGCQIQIWLKKPINQDDPQMVIRELDGSLFIEADRQLTPEPDNPSGDCPNTPYRSKLCKHFRHNGDSSGYDPTIERVRIVKKNGDEAFQKDINEKDHYHGCRILIWWR